MVECWKMEKKAKRFWILKKKETMEAQAASFPITDLGRPILKEIQDHELTHLPHRSWCGSFVAGRSRDRAHNRQKKSDGPLEVPNGCSGTLLLGFRGWTRNNGWVARDVGTKMLCSHNVPKKGLSVSHGVAQLLEDTDRLEH